MTVPAPIALAAEVLLVALAFVAALVLALVALVLGCAGLATWACRREEDAWERAAHEAAVDRLLAEAGIPVQSPTREPA